MNRIIFHVDMDAFFASVEIVNNPMLRGKPVIVGGEINSRGVVSTCSYEAREFGVRSAMPMKEAHRLCPHGVFLKGNYEKYREYSQRIMGIFYHFTPLVEQVSIDEAYLDVTQEVSKYGGAMRLGKVLKEVIFKQLKLTCSVGIAANKLIAKISSSHRKPNGLFGVPPGKEAEFLAPLSVMVIPGVGPATERVLNREGIKLVSDVQARSVDEMIKLLGTHGYHLHLSAFGKDNRPLAIGDYDPKSIGSENTFQQDVSDKEILVNTLKEQTLSNWESMRKRKMRTGKVTIKLRFSDFTTITRSKTLFSQLIELEEITQEVIKLFETHYLGNPPLRLIGISLGKLTSGYWQPTLF